MTLASRHLATKLDIPCLDSVFLSQCMLDVHDCFNKRVFPNELHVPVGFNNMCTLVYSSFKQEAPALIDVSLGDKHIIKSSKSKDVLLGFSAGLDSVYQAILLKELGYDVHLFFAKNINTYENGQAWKYAEQIASKLGLELMAMTVKKNMRKGKNANDFRQSWPENPIKNQLILSVMVDMCIERGWHFISLGDDFDLAISKSVPGVNTTDAKEVTCAFLDGLKEYVDGIDFLKIPAGHDKGIRLQKMIDYSLQDLYYSCVQAGRLNKYMRKLTQDKYGVKLFGNNCGKCRKCCMHNLILHYSGKIVFPSKFIDDCWKKMYTTGCKADYEFFKPELPLEVRIANLFNY